MFAILPARAGEARNAALTSSEKPPVAAFDSKADFGGSLLLCRVGMGAVLATVQTLSFCNRQNGYSAWYDRRGGPNSLSSSVRSRSTSPNGMAAWSPRHQRPRAYRTSKG